MTMAMSACGTDPTPDRVLSTNPYISYQLNIHAAIMSKLAPYDTLQLVATPRLASGDVLQTPGTPVFQSTDDSVTVSPTGLLHAVGKSNGTAIIATLQDPVTGVTHADTAIITVTAGGPPVSLAAFSIQRPATDSGRLSVATTISGTFPTDTVQLIATDSAGNDMRSTAQVRFASSAPNVAVIDAQTGIAYGLREGKTTLVATTTYYGVTKRDSVQLLINPDPVLAHVVFGPVGTAADGTSIMGFTQPTVTLGVGGTVTFGFDLLTDVPGLILDVVFDDPNAAQPSAFPMQVAQGMSGSGDIAPLTRPANADLFGQCFDFANITWGLYRCQVARAFFTPGTYHYHSAKYGAKGTIVIRARDDVAPPR